MSDGRDRLTCRGCGSPAAHVLSFGRTPLADRLVDPESPAASDPLVPLDLHLCGNCTLLQIGETVAPDQLFDDGYPYLSSTSSTLVERSRAHAFSLIDRCGLGPSSRVVEIACNDGYMLQHFVARGIPVLGIDPAGIPVGAARARGIPVRQRFFDPALAETMAAAGETADLVIANNVLAHTPTPRDFVASMARILRPDGLLTIDVPWVFALLDAGAFDTVYHQHVGYLSLHAIRHLLAGAGLTIVDVFRIPAQGGSLRVYASKTGEPSDRVASLLAEERDRGVADIETFRQLGTRARDLAAAVRDAVLDARRCGQRVGAYGAAAKGTMLLHACRLGRTEIDYVVDRNRAKQGRLLPGSRLPVVGPERLRDDPPDLLFVLPWNIADEIIREQRGYAAAGGRFLVPLPEPRIVGPARRSHPVVPRPAGVA